MWWEIRRGGAGVNTPYCVCRLGTWPELDMRGRGGGEWERGREKRRIEKEVRCKRGELGEQGENERERRAKKDEKKVKSREEVRNRERRGHTQAKRESTVDHL